MSAALKPEKKKSQRANIIFLLVIVLLLIPQTRTPIQVALHKVIGVFSPSVKLDGDLGIIKDYNWKLINDSGVPFDFNEARNKVVVVNFWATWCPPCIAEMPSLNKLYEAYNDRLVILYISDEADETVAKFKQKRGYKFPVYHAVSEYPKAFNVTSIPRTFVIDKQGRIVVDKTGAANWFSEGFQKELDNLINAN